MDPLTIIITAMVTGAALALQDTTQTAIKDGYAALKTLILTKYGEQGAVRSAVCMVEADPTSEARGSLLREELEKAKADQDTEVVNEAKDLLSATQGQSSPARSSGQSACVSGSNNTTQQVTQSAGDHAFQVGIVEDGKRSK